jgi:hypothetical protein
LTPEPASSTLAGLRPATKNVLALLAITLAVLVAFTDVLGPERGLFFRDHLNAFKPKWWAVVESLRDGQLPALTHASPAGVPFESMLNGTYSPPALAFLFGSFDTAYDLFVLAHYLILGFGVFGLARSLAASRSEALVAAAVGALAGPVVSCNDLVQNLDGLAWVPWIAWAFHQLLLAPGPRPAGALALTVGFQLQCVIPEVLILDLVAAALVAIEAHRSGWPKSYRPAFGWSVGAALLGLGMAALVLFPVLEYLPSTRRWAGFSYQEASQWPFRLALLPELLVPSFWAPPDTPILNPPAFTGSENPPYLASLQFGSALALVAVGLGGVRGGDRAQRRTTRVLAATVVFAALVAFGAATPLHRLLWSLPVFRSTRFPIKYLLVVGAALAPLAALGLRRAKDRPETLVGAAAVQTLVLGGLWIAIHRPEWKEVLAAQLTSAAVSAPFIGVEPRTYPTLAVEAMEPRVLLGLEFALLLTLLGALAWRGRDETRRDLARSLIPLAVLAELALGARSVIPGAPVHPDGPPPWAITALRQGEHRLYTATPGGRKPAVHHVEGHTFFEDAVVSSNRRGYDPYRTLRVWRDLDLDAQSNRWSVLVTRLLVDAPARESLRLLARAGVGWITTPMPLRLGGVLMLEIPEESPQYLLPLVEARPYVHAFTRARRLDGEGGSPAELRAAATSPEGWETAILFEDDPPPELTANSTTCAAPHTTWRAVDTRTVLVEVDSACPALAVLLEARMMQWSAEVDGAPAHLYTAEFGQLGAAVGAGRHQVRFTYHALVDRWAPLSICSALVALALMAFGALRARRTTTGA